MILDAAGGEAAQRDAFATRCAAPVIAYRLARWGGLPLLQVIEDAAQETFVECVREGGEL